MGLTELFNEWIVERGSAKVQEKHIALFRDQLTMADKRIAKLESELKNSQARINQHTKENAVLSQKIKAYENSSHTTSIDDTKIKILIFLSKFSSGDELDANDIASACEISDQVALFHLEELDKIRYVSASLAIGRPPLWYIAHEGRRYLIQHGLL